MKAISLWQPWASLIACGAKQFETRDWAPPRSLIGQTIAIHAAKKIDKGAAEFAEELCYGQYQPGGFDLADKLEATMDGATDELMGVFGQAVMPIGCVVAMARLEAAFRLGGPEEGTVQPAAKIVGRLTLRPELTHPLTVPYDGFGDYSEGRWAWLLTNVKPINPPIAAKGAQGFFDLPQGWLTGGGQWEAAG